MNPLEERLRQASDTRLWDILRNPLDYQEEAVRFARKELQRRGQNPQTLPEADPDPGAFLPQWFNLERWLNALLDSLFRPRKTALETRFRVIQVLSLLFLLRLAYSVWELYFSWGLAFTRELILENPLSTGMTVGSCLVYILGTFLLWRKITAGWGIMMFLHTLTLLSAVLACLGILWKLMLYLIGMYDMFPEYALGAAMALGLGWLLDVVLAGFIAKELNHADTREAFRVQKTLRRLMFYIPLWITVLSFLVRLWLASKTMSYEAGQFENIAPPVAAYPDETQ